MAYLCFRNNAGRMETRAHSAGKPLIKNPPIVDRVSHKKKKKIVRIVRMYYYAKKGRRYRKDANTAGSNKLRFIQNMMQTKKSDYSEHSASLKSLLLKNPERQRLIVVEIEEQAFNSHSFAIPLIAYVTSRKYYTTTVDHTVKLVHVREHDEAPLQLHYKIEQPFFEHTEWLDHVNVSTDSTSFFSHLSKNQASFLKYCSTHHYDEQVKKHDKKQHANTSARVRKDHHDPNYYWFHITADKNVTNGKKVHYANIGNYSHHVTEKYCEWHGYSTHRSFGARWNEAHSHRKEEKDHFLQHLWNTQADLWLEYRTKATAFQEVQRVQKGLIGIEYRPGVVGRVKKYIASASQPTE